MSDRPKWFDAAEKYRQQCESYVDSGAKGLTVRESKTAWVHCEEPVVIRQ